MLAMPVIQPRAENIYIAGLCFLVTVICVGIILRGLLTGKPPMRKGIGGTSLENSKTLLYIQVVLLTGLAAASGTMGYLLMRALPY